MNFKVVSNGAILTQLLLQAIELSRNFTEKKKNQFQVFSFAYFLTLPYTALPEEQAALLINKSCWLMEVAKEQAPPPQKGDYNEELLVRGGAFITSKATLYKCNTQSVHNAKGKDHS